MEEELYVQVCSKLGLQPLEGLLLVLGGSKAEDVILKELDERDAAGLLAVLGQSRLIRRLHLPHSSLGLNGIRLLGKALAENGVLADLSLAWSKDVGNAGAAAIAVPLLSCQSTNIRELSLCGCNLGLEGVDAIVETFVTLPSMRNGCVDLSHNDLPRQCGILLGKLIRSSNGPRVLNLSNNHLGDCGAAAIGGALAADLQRLAPQFATLNLQILNLAYNNIGDRGLAKLVEGVRTHLEGKDKGEGQIQQQHELSGDGDAAAQRVPDANRSGAPPCHLENLVLAGNKISDHGCVQYVTQLLCKPVIDQGLLLQRLDISDNTRIGDAGIHALAVSLREQQPPLSVLDLTGAMLGLDGLQAMGSALAENRVLRGLHLSLPPLEAGAEAGEGKQGGQVTEEQEGVLVQGLVKLAEGAAQSSLTDLTLERSEEYVKRHPMDVGLALLRVDKALAANKTRGVAPVASPAEPHDSGDVNVARQEGSMATSTAAPAAPHTSIPSATISNPRCLSPSPVADSVSTSMFEFQASISSDAEGDISCSSPYHTTALGASAERAERIDATIRRQLTAVASPGTTARTDTSPTSHNRADATAVQATVDWGLGAQHSATAVTDSTAGGTRDEAQARLQARRERALAERRKQQGKPEQQQLPPPPAVRDDDPPQTQARPTADHMDDHARPAADGVTDLHPARSNTVDCTAPTGPAAELRDDTVSATVPQGQSSATSSPADVSSSSPAPTAESTSALPDQSLVAPVLPSSAPPPCEPVSLSSGGTVEVAVSNHILDGVSQLVPPTPTSVVPAVDGSASQQQADPPSEVKPQQHESTEDGLAPAPRSGAQARLQARLAGRKKLQTGKDAEENHQQQQQQQQAIVQQEPALSPPQHGVEEAEHVSAQQQQDQQQMPQQEAENVTQDSLQSPPTQTLQSQPPVEIRSEENEVEQDPLGQDQEQVPQQESHQPEQMPLDKHEDERGQEETSQATAVSQLPEEFTMQQPAVPMLQQNEDRTDENGGVMDEEIYQQQPFERAVSVDTTEVSQERELIDQDLVVVQDQEAAQDHSQEASPQQPLVERQVADVVEGDKGQAADERSRAASAPSAVDEAAVWSPPTPAIVNETVEPAIPRTPSPEVEPVVAIAEDSYAGPSLSEPENQVEGAVVILPPPQELVLPHQFTVNEELEFKPSVPLSSPSSELISRSMASQMVLEAPTPVDSGITHSHVVLELRPPPERGVVGQVAYVAAQEHRAPVGCQQQEQDNNVMEDEYYGLTEAVETHFDCRQPQQLHDQGEQQSSSPPPSPPHQEEPPSPPEQSAVQSTPDSEPQLSSSRRPKSRPSSFTEAISEALLSPLPASSSASLLLAPLGPLDQPVSVTTIRIPSPSLSSTQRKRSPPGPDKRPTTPPPFYTKKVDSVSSGNEELAATLRVAAPVNEIERLDTMPVSLTEETCTPRRSRSPPATATSTGPATSSQQLQPPQQRGNDRQGEEEDGDTRLGPSATIVGYSKQRTSSSRSSNEAEDAATAAFLQLDGHEQPATATLQHALSSSSHQDQPSDSLNTEPPPSQQHQGQQPPEQVSRKTPSLPGLGSSSRGGRPLGDGDSEGALSSSSEDHSTSRERLALVLQQRKVLKPSQRLRHRESRKHVHRRPLPLHKEAQDAQNENDQTEREQPQRTNGDGGSERLTVSETALREADAKEAADGRGLAPNVPSPPQWSIPVNGAFDLADVAALKAFLDALPTHAQDKSGLQEVWNRVSNLEGKLDAVMLMMAARQRHRSSASKAQKKDSNSRPAPPRGKQEDQAVQKEERSVGHMATAAGGGRSPWQWGLRGRSGSGEGRRRADTREDEEEVHEEKKEGRRSPNKRRAAGKEGQEEGWMWSSAELQSDLAPVVKAVVQKQAVAIAQRLRTLEGRLIEEEKNSIDVLEKIIAILSRSRRACGGTTNGRSDKRRRSSSSERRRPHQGEVATEGTHMHVHISR